MIQINPLSREESKRRSANSLRSVVSALQWQVCNLKEKPNRVTVSRLCELLIKIKQRFVPSYDDAERLESKVRDAMDDGEFTVSLEGDRLFVSGYIKVNKLSKGVIW
jgi:hypothetical protein